MSVYFPELSNFDDTEIIEKNRNKNKLNNKHSSNVVEISECNNNNYHCISNMTFPSVRSVLWYVLMYILLIFFIEMTCYLLFLHVYYGM